MRQQTNREISQAAELVQFAYTSAAAMARKSFTSAQDDWAPMLFFRTPAGVMHVVAVPMIEGRKDDIAMAIAAMLKMNQATEAVLLTSAWMVARPAGTGSIENLRPSEHPDRREALVLAGVDEATAITRVAPINRYTDRPPTLEPLEDTAEGPGIAGRFIDALRLGIG